MTGDLIWWLAQPVDASRAHVVGAMLSWHARLMVLAWGIIAPLAVLIARFYKITPGQDWPRVLDNPFWWRVHWKGQTLVALLSVVALLLIVLAGRIATGAPLHRFLGWLILVGTAAQIASGFFRGSKGGPTAPAPDGLLSGDHYDMTRHRLLFELFHKLLGYALLMLAVICLLLGLWAANAPNWMWIVVLLWWALLVVAAILLQMKGRAFDTYQAIWGPDPTLPGNRMKKQGWGTVRPGDRSAKTDTGRDA